MLDGRYPSRGVRRAAAADRLGPRRPARSARARAPARSRSPTPARSRSRAVLGQPPRRRRVGELDEEMVYEARPGQAFLLGAIELADRGDHARPRDRHPAPGVPGAVPFWKGDGLGRPRELGEAIGAFSRWAVEQDAGTLADELRPRPARRAEPRRVPARAAGGHPRRAQRPHDRRRALPRRDRRLAAVRALPYGGRVHAAWGLALSARIREEYGLESDAIWSDDGIIVHLPDADEPPGVELRDDRARRARGPGRRRARRLRAVRRALPRERRPRAADPARLPGPPHAAVAAAAEVADPARGRPALRPVPDRARDLPRVPARCARRPRPPGAPAQAALARARAGRGRDADRVAVRLLAAVRLRRDVHVRGRHAQRRAPRGRAGARPRPAARAARPGGAARADRPGALEPVEADLQRISERTRADSPDALHDVLRRVGDLTPEPSCASRVGADLEAWLDSSPASGAP